MTAAPLDPLHMISGPGVAWSRVNLSEAMPGVLSPLGWTFWSDATEASARRIFWRLGVIPRSGLAPPTRPDDRFIGIFFGRAAANVDWIHHKVVRLPGANPEAFELQYFGSVRPGVDHGLVRTRYPAIAAKFPVAGLGNPGRVRAVRREIDAWWRRSIAALADDRAVDARRLFADAYHRFTGVLTEHGMATMLTQAVYERAAALAARAGHPGLEQALCAGWGPTEETRLVTDLWDAARTGAGIDTVLATHGYHGPDEGELSSRPWREDPAPLAAMLDRYRRLDDGASPDGATQRRTAERRAAVATLLAGLPPTRRAPARLLLRAVRTYVPQREVGKAAFLQTFDVARAAARALGVELAKSGDLDDPEDIFFLTAMEVLTGLPPDAKALIRARRAKRDEYRTLEVPESWTGPATASPSTAHPATTPNAADHSGPADPPNAADHSGSADGPNAADHSVSADARNAADSVGAAAISDASSSGRGASGGDRFGSGAPSGAGPAAGTIEGLGVSAGIAEGPARVILGPAGIPDVEPGEILVCPTTDPSWAPAMLIAAALVIDTGGALSHGAIVARELGVPCVINTRAGTTVLRSGDHLKVDGTSGRVEFTRP